ncbi:MAG: phosphoglycolate phosphatase [Pseudohongiellaceae bacterium]|jgi:phosphoglycolate phosphatase
MKQLDAVLFDLDGTLLDTAPDFFVVVNKLCRRHGWPKKDYQTIRDNVSNGSKALITLVSGMQPEDNGFDDLRQQLLDLYIDHLAVETCLFEGLEDTINWLEKENIHWGIVTNKPRLYTESLLDQLKLSERCATVVCPDDVSANKPNPESLYLACSQLNIKPANAIYIGDHRRDIEAGLRAGMPTIAVNYGYNEAHDPADSWGADHLAEHGSDLIGIIQTKIRC